jgi:hypothetical protein
MPTIDRKPDRRNKPNGPQEIDDRLSNSDHLNFGAKWLRMEYQHGGHLLNKSECVSLAKKLLCRGLDCELTRAEVEAFLRDKP